MFPSPLRTVTVTGPKSRLVVPRKLKLPFQAKEAGDKVKSAPLRLSIAPPAMVKTPEPAAPGSPRFNWPAESLKPPPKLLATGNVNTPLPVLVSWKLFPLSKIEPPTVKPLELTAIVVLAFIVTLPAPVLKLLAEPE